MLFGSCSARQEHREADSTDSTKKDGEASGAPPPPEGAAFAEAPQAVKLEIDPSQIVSALFQLLPTGLQELAKLGSQKSRQEHERILQLDRLYSEERRHAKVWDTTGAIVALSLAAVALAALLWAVHEQLVTESNAVAAGAILAVLWHSIRGLWADRRATAERPRER